MKLIYIYHSCFLLEEDNFLLLIDYFKDTEGYNNGIVHNYMSGYTGRIYILSSHSHPDHFNKSIFNWSEENKDIIYILSDDIASKKDGKKEGAVYLKEGQIYKDDLLLVKAYGSTDIGISFYIEAEGKKIFHAGDLNNWHWREESTPEESAEYEAHYLRELGKLTADVKALNVVMFPVDSRLGKDYMLGAEQLLDQIKVNTFVPMHFDEEYEKANAFESYAIAKGTVFAKLTHKGQLINL